MVDTTVWETLVPTRDQDPHDRRPCLVLLGSLRSPLRRNGTSIPTVLCPEVLWGNVEEGGSILGPYPPQVGVVRSTRDLGPEKQDPRCESWVLWIVLHSSGRGVKQMRGRKQIGGRLTGKREWKRT